MALVARSVPAVRSEKAPVKKATPAPAVEKKPVAKKTAAPVKKAGVAAKPAAVKKAVAPVKLASATKPAPKKTMLKRELDTKVRSLSALINEIAIEAEAHGYTLVYPVVDGKIVPMLSMKK